MADNDNLGPLDNPLLDAMRQQSQVMQLVQLSSKVASDPHRSCKINYLTAIVTGLTESNLDTEFLTWDEVEAIVSDTRRIDEEIAIELQKQGLTGDNADGARVAEISDAVITRLEPELKFDVENQTLKS